MGVSCLVHQMSSVLGGEEEHKLREVQEVLVSCPRLMGEVSCRGSGLTRAYLGDSGDDKERGHRAVTCTSMMAGSTRGDGKSARLMAGLAGP